MKKEQFHLLPSTTSREEAILHFSLAGLLHDHALALNPTTRTLCLLTNGPRMLIEQQFSATELRLLVPLLKAYPHYCPYEVLLANIASANVTERLIDRSRQHLLEAQHNGTWQQELRPIRRALTSLRIKLHDFNIEVTNIRERGCSLTTI